MLTRLRRLSCCSGCRGCCRCSCSAQSGPGWPRTSSMTICPTLEIRDTLGASYFCLAVAATRARLSLEVTRGGAGCRSSLVTRACDWGILRYAQRPGVHSPTWKLGGARQTRLRAAVSSWTCVGRQAENSAHQNSALDALPRMSCLVAQYRSRPERSSSDCSLSECSDVCVLV